MKIPFDIKYRPQIESGEYKVETKNGEHVEILKWDMRSINNPYPILAVVSSKKGDEAVRYSDKGYCGRADYSLFLVTPEQELSEFEKAVGLEIFDEPFEERHIKVIKEESAELLALARDQIIKDGYVIEKKAFHDAVEKVAPEVMKEVSDKVDIEEAIRLGYEKSRADALKDLPRWKKCADGPKPKPSNEWIFSIDSKNVTRESAIVHNGYFLPLFGLEKLPGFNE